VGGAGPDHNTEREDKVGLGETGMGSIGRAGAVEVVGGVVDEIATAVDVPAPRTEVSEREVGPRRPSEVVHGHSQRYWSRQSTVHLKEGFRKEWVWSGSRARLRWQP
jgi:hypothetical protein